MKDWLIVHNFKVLYFAYKEGLGFGPRSHAPRMIALTEIQPTVSQDSGMSRFDAFKKFYKAVATCPVTKVIMTDPVIGPDGNCYQRGYEPDLSIQDEDFSLIDAEAAEVERSNQTLKTALEEMGKKSEPNEQDYVNFYQSVTQDLISLEAAIDPILDGGCVRSEKQMHDQNGWDIQGNGAQWEEGNPPPKVCFRYTGLQKAIYQLSYDLDVDDLANKSILEEIKPCTFPSDSKDIISVISGIVIIYRCDVYT